MKLRIRANSLRLRLNQKEVEALAEGQVLAEKVEFPGGNALSYSLKVFPAGEAQASFSDGSIQIAAPRMTVVNWASGEEIGLYFSLPAGAETLKISIEKDLVCIDGPPEEVDPLAFPRELSQAAC